MTSFRAAAIAAILLLCGPAAAQQDIPLTDWPVPSATAGGISTMVDIGSPGVFVAMVPCRVVDTRNANGTYGGPKLTAGVVRSFNIEAGSCAGIPGGASAYSLNLTVTETNGAGFVTAYPKGGSVPSTSSVNYTGAGQTVANAAIVPAGTLANVDSISVVAGVSGTHLIIDINGYFLGSSGMLNAGEQLALHADAPGNAAIVGFNWSNTNGSHGVGGYAGGTGAVHGVQGQIGSTAGVYASGVHGITTDRDRNFGVLGDVTGYGGGTYWGSQVGAGVMGRGTRQGVGGYANPPVTGSSSRGISGSVLSSSYVVDVAGTLGLVYQASGEKYGVYYSGGLGGFGTKSFIEPHPTDPERLVRYYSLEGPESGTYCRGSAETSGRVAVIELPETFRWVTDAEGITVQVTPTGSDFVSVRVESKDSGRIVIRTSKETTFDWLVQGVRRAYREAEVTPRSELLKPEGPDARIPEFLSAEERRRVIESGLYNPDGSVNRHTAERLGWAREWREREAAVRP